MSRYIINDVIFFIKPYFIGNTQCGYSWEDSDRKSLPYATPLMALQGAIDYQAKGGSEPECNYQKENTESFNRRDYA
jgi:hypothetical protein